MIDDAVEFIADNNSAKGVQPSDRAFDLTAETVAPPFAAVLRRRSDAAATERQDEVPLRREQRRANAVAVERAIGDQRSRLNTDRDFLDDA